ncbi:hypothetical protein KHA96_11575 [Bacillus sp. FJAT-49711]|uniref:DUF6056 family protein n=1 Tax=Bacillus sp. FJAT-49711 TaxID=2833585 RepID=UPI001BC99201|nr:DUF6056 family protein [Bacillus sp. FJAT-49711]MBS4218955.1 hypothetical protein [Bacillus sp. FJAT-49711]
MKFPIIYLTMLYIFFFLLSYNVPLTGDDWAWGTNIGIKRLKSGFADYNGRYLSNILEIILTRYDLLRYITIALFSTLLVYIVGKLTDHQNKNTTYLLSFILFLLIPIRIFSQTFGWTAGFVNYVPSVVLLLLYIFIVRNIFDETKPTYRKWQSFIIFPLGLATQLIVEHVTLFALFTSACIVVFTYLRHKKVYAIHLSYMFSVIVGSIIMFTNSAYINVLKGNDDYRTVNNDLAAQTGLFDRIYEAYSGNMYKLLFLNNMVVNVLIGILIIVLLVRFVSSSKWVNFVLKPILLSVISGFILFLLVFKNVLGRNFLGVYTNDFEAIISLLFFISVIVSIVLFVKIRETKFRLLYYLSGIVLLTAPFIFITPFGPRCVFASYTFMVLVALELFSYLTKTLSWDSKYLKKPLLSLSCVIIIVYVFILSMNGTTNRDRLAHLENEVSNNKKIVELRELPFPQFHWMSSPKPRKYHTKVFKRFYGVPSDTKIKLIRYYKWKEK